MANILFKRGLHNQLPTKAVDGAFYLTTDSHRLYVGIDEQLVDLNQYIVMVDYPADLPTENVEIGDFAYIKNDNILAVYTNENPAKPWVQINQNTDTTITDVAFSGDSATDPGKLTITLSDSENGTISDEITFIGTNGTDVTVDADGNVTIAGCTYEIGGKLDGSTFTVTLATGDEEVEDTAFTLVKGNNINFAQGDTENDLVISAIDTQLSTSAEDNTIEVDGGKLKVTIKDTALNAAVAESTEDVFYYSVGENGDVTVANQGKLPVYTISEIDKKINGLNAMTYKGTVNTAQALKDKVTEGVKVGDTFMVAQGFKMNDITGEDASCKIGDLFIAAGVEDETTGLLTEVEWTYVPSGDDAQTDTNYYAIVDTVNHAITFKSTTTEDPMAKIDVDSDGKIILTSTASKLLGTEDYDNSWKLEIKHAAAGEAVLEATEENQALNATEITAVIDVDVDETGHVSKFTTKKHVLLDYDLAEAEVELEATDVAVVSNTLVDSTSGTHGTASFKINASANDSLKLSVDAAEKSVNISLEWDTF